MYIVHDVISQLCVHNNAVYYMYSHNINLLQILSSDGNQEVGVITRQWPGLFETFFSFEARHTFGISCKLY
jgi:hypothetical protein